MLKQLRIKFVAVTMSLVTVLLCVILAMVYSLTSLALSAETTLKMQSVSESLSHPGPLPESAFFDDRLHYFIISRDIRGSLIAIGNTTFDLTDPVLVRELYKAADTAPDPSGVIDDQSLQFTDIPNRPGTYLYVDVSKEEHTLKTLATNCILIWFASCAVFGVLCTLFAKRIVRPVETAWEQQKQFVADASHELKTPLTVIMTNTEMLASPAYSAEEKSRFVENTAEMTKRMRSLVEGMLDLARLDSGVVRSTFTELDYSDLTEQCTLPFEPMYFESGRMLESDITPNIRLSGSETHLKQVTDILLDNALKYSYPNTTVLLTLRTAGRFSVLCVDSIGDPISKEDLQNIFHRFYTVDKARTGSSYGLGLSIAQSIVEEHKGKIWAENSGNHNRFYVKLPL